MDQFLFIYATPQVMQAFGWKIATVGDIVSTSFLLGMIAAPIAGALTDVYGARRTLPVFLGLSALAVGFLALTVSGPLFAILRVIGFGLSAAIAAITNTIVARAATPRHRSMLLAVLQCGYPLGGFLAANVFALFGAAHWRKPFLAGFVVVPLALLLGWVLPRMPAPARPSGSKSSFTELFAPDLRSRSVLLILAFFMFGLAAGSTVFSLPTYFQQARGYAPSQAALLVGWAGIFGIGGNFLSAFVNRWWLSARATTVLWLGIAVVLLQAAFWLPRTYVEDFVAFAVAGPFFYGTAAIIVACVMENMPDRVKGAASGLCASAAVNAGLIIGPILLVRLAPGFGWRGGYAIITGGALAGCALTLLALPPPPAPDAALAEA
jgi:predicted MFS family arabinose efflux permease